MILTIKTLILLFALHVFMPVHETDPIHLEIKVKNPTCTGVCDGDVMLTVTGGQPGYRYAWSNGMKSEYYHNVCAGKGSVTVTDIAGNSASIEYEVINPPPIGIEKLLVTQPTAGLSNGSIEINVTGGLLPYKFSLDGTNFSTSNVFNGLAPGSYVLSIRDTNGCLVQSGTIDLSVKRDMEDITTGYHLYFNAETKIMHLYSNMALTMQLTDLQGRALLAEELNKDHDIPMNDLDYGVYFLKISDGVRSAYEKIVK